MAARNPGLALPTYAAEQECYDWIPKWTSAQPNDGTLGPNKIIVNEIRVERI